jgi:hypothetical protein
MDVRPEVMGRLSNLQQIKAKEILSSSSLADSPSFSYRKKLLSGGADFVFHRSNEFGKMLESIRELNGKES